MPSLEDQITLLTAQLEQLQSSPDKDSPRVQQSTRCLTQQRDTLLVLVQTMRCPNPFLAVAVPC